MQITFVVDADSMLVADGTAAGDYCLGGRLLEQFPARQGFGWVFALPKEVGRINAGALRVGVGEMGKGKDALIFLAEGFFQCRLDAEDHRFDLVPETGRLQRIDDVSFMPKAFPQIGDSKAALFPVFSGRCADGSPTLFFNEAESLVLGGADLIPIAREADQEQAFVFCDSFEFHPFFQQPFLQERDLYRELRFGFFGIAQAKHGDGEIGLDQLPNCFKARIPRGEEAAVNVFCFWDGADAHNGFGDDPVAPFRT